MKYLTFTDHNQITEIRDLKPLISYITELLITVQKNITFVMKTLKIRKGINELSLQRPLLYVTVCSNWFAFSEKKDTNFNLEYYKYVELYPRRGPQVISDIQIHILQIHIHGTFLPEFLSNDSVVSNKTCGGVLNHFQNWTSIFNFQIGNDSGLLTNIGRYLLNGKHVFYFLMSVYIFQ